MSSTATLRNWTLGEEIIDRELITDGEVRGDDRNLQGALSSSLQWCVMKKDTIGVNLNEDQRRNLKEQNRSMLENIEYAMRQATYNWEKTRLIKVANERQALTYNDMISSIENQISEAVQTIEKCKRELVVAKVSKRQRQEYDVLARMILNYPDRDDLRQKLCIVEKEIEIGKRRIAELDERFETARRKFFALGALLRSLEDDNDYELGELGRDISGELASTNLHLSDLPSREGVSAAPTLTSTNNMHDDSMDDDDDEGVVQSPKTTDDSNSAAHLKIPKLTKTFGPPVPPLEDDRSKDLNDDDKMDT